MACLLAGVLIYSGCKKNELISDENSGNTIAEAQGNTCISAKEFFVALGDKLNTQGTNNSPATIGTTNLETIIYRDTYVTFEYDDGSVPTICQNEQVRIANDVLKEARDRAKAFCPQGKDRILAFAVERLNIPQGTPGTTIKIELIVTALVGCKVPQLQGACPPWTVSDIPWPGLLFTACPDIDNPPASFQNQNTPTGRLENALNNIIANCNTNIPENCPPEGIPPGPPPPINYYTTCTVVPPATTCQVWSETISYNNGYADSYLEFSDLNSAFNNAIANINTYPPYCTCQSQDAQIVFYDVRCGFEYLASHL